MCNIVANKNRYGKKVIRNIVCICVWGLKETQGYWKLDHSLWRTRFRKGCGTFVGVAVVQLVEAMCCNWFRFPMRSLRFFIDLILQSSLWPWGRLWHLTEMCTRNISLGVGGYRWPEMCRADNLTNFMCRLSVHSGRHNLVETWGPLQVCNEITLPLRTCRRTDNGMNEWKNEWLNEWMKWMCACVCYACECICM
jgi:hypothetical protein